MQHSDRSFIDRVVTLDPSDGVTAVLPPELWPWATLSARKDSGVPAAHPVDIDRTVDSSMYVAADSGLNTATVMQRISDTLATDAPETRSLIWLGSDGVELGRGDLAYTNNLRFHGAQRVFIPSRIEGLETGPVRIHVRPWSDRHPAGQAYMPIYDLDALSFPPALKAAPALLSSQLPQRIAVYVLINDERAQQPLFGHDRERQLA